MQSNQLTAIALAIAIAVAAGCGSRETGDDEREPAAVAERTTASDAPDDAAAPEPTGGDIDAAAAPAGPLEAELRAYERARGVFEEHCEHCHAPTDDPSPKRKKALKHLTMGDYPFGGHHAADLASAIRKVLGVTGEKPTMPKDDPGAVQGDQLDLILQWAEAFDAAAEAGVGHHAGAGGHGH